MPIKSNVFGSVVGSIVGEMLSWQKPDAGGGAVDYGIPLVGWSDTGDSYDPSAQETRPHVTTFDGTGSKMFVTGKDSGVISEFAVTDYSLTTPTPSYTRNLALPTSDTVSGQWWPDGKGYVHTSNNGRVYQETFSTPWDLTTAGTSASVIPSGLATSWLATCSIASGAKQLVLDLHTNIITQYTVTNAPYDISGGLVADGSSVDVSAQFGFVQARDMVVSASGEFLTIVDYTDAEIHVYRLTTPNTIADGLALEHTIDVSSLMTTPQGIFFREAEGKAYVTSQAGDAVFELDYTGLAGDLVLNISGAVYNSQQITTFAGGDPTALCFKPDGTKVFGANKTAGNSNIYQYTLSTPWDLSTAGGSTTLTTTRNLITRGITFNGDGTKMFLYDANDQFYERWTLSTPWDVTTGTFDTGQTSTKPTLGSASQLAPDLTSVFCIKGTDIIKDTFATAGDMTSTLTTGVQTLDLSAYSPSQLGNVQFTSDGLVAFIVSRAAVYSHIVLQLTVAYDLDTATVSSTHVNFAEESSPTAGFIVPEESLFFAVGVSLDDCSRYSY